MSDVKTNLEDMSRKELIRLVNGLRVTNNKLLYLKVEKQAKLRRYEARFQRIRNEIDYLLLHPFSRDSSYQTRPHSRDIKNPLSRTLNYRKKK